LQRQPCAGHCQAGTTAVLCPELCAPCDPPST
jgi:hypothetical protein